MWIAPDRDYFLPNGLVSGEDIHDPVGGQTDHGFFFPFLPGTVCSPTTCWEDVRPGEHLHSATLPAHIAARSGLDCLLRDARGCLRMPEDAMAQVLDAKPKQALGAELPQTD